MDIIDATTITTSIVNGISSISEAIYEEAIYEGRDIDAEEINNFFDALSAAISAPDVAEVQHIITDTPDIVRADEHDLRPLFEFISNPDEGAITGLLDHIDKWRNEIFDNIESTTYLIGDWIKDDAGDYQPDKEDGIYAAIVTFGDSFGGTCDVCWSKYVAAVRSTSPCFMMNTPIPTCCGDLDSPSDTGVWAYCLPKEFYEEPS